MRIWLPYVEGGGGSDVSTEHLARSLELKGHDVFLQKFHHNFQYVPFVLLRIPPPPQTDLIIAHSWNAFAFRRKGARLIAVERLFVLAQDYRPYRSFAQSIFHEAMLRPYMSWSFRAADAVVSLSRASAEQIQHAYPWVDPAVILSGVDTEFFCPPVTERPPFANRRIRLLFVGNLVRRKGVDLLSPILSRLGDRYELHYASGLRTPDRPLHPQAKSLGRLNLKEVCEAYKNADVLIFPSRHEGLSRVAMEAQSCGLPVVVSNASSLPESLEDGVSGHVCPVDDVEAFADAVRSITENDAVHATYRKAAREVALQKFSLDRMVDEYVDLGERLIRSQTG